MHIEIYDTTLRDGTQREGLSLSGSDKLHVARKLDVPRLALLVNKVPAVFDAAEVKARVEKTYNCEVVAVLPHSDEMMTLASAGIFVLRYPDHPVTAQLKQALTRLMA